MLEIDKVNQLCDTVEALGLDRGLHYDRLTSTQRAAAYNGAGPEWFPAWGRECLDFAMRLFAPAVLIHDIDFANSNGTKAVFKAANKRLWRNMRILIAAEFPARHFELWPRRAYWFAKGYLAYRACVRGGWSAWEAGAQ